MLELLSEGWSWRQDDPGSATVEEVIAEILKATDVAIFTGCNMIGQVLWLARTAPAWTLVCDGATYLKADYPDLWGVLDSNYEVSGAEFRVPDLIARFPLGSSLLGVQGGESEHTLTVAELPAHTHGEQDPGSVVVQSGAGAIALSDPGLPSQTGSTGGDQPFPIMPPYETLLPVIVARLPNA